MLECLVKKICIYIYILYSFIFLWHLPVLVFSITICNIYILHYLTIVTPSPSRGRKKWTSKLVHVVGLGWLSRNFTRKQTRITAGNQGETLQRRCLLTVHAKKNQEINTFSSVLKHGICTKRMQGFTVADGRRLHLKIPPRLFPEERMRSAAQMVDHTCCGGRKQSRLDLCLVVLLRDTEQCFRFMPT